MAETQGWQGTIGVSFPITVLQLGPSEQGA